MFSHHLVPAFFLFLCFFLSFFLPSYPGGFFPSLHASPVARHNHDFPSSQQQQQQPPPPQPQLEQPQLQQAPYPDPRLAFPRVTAAMSSLEDTANSS
jgi:hypothetical protein